MEEVKKQQDNEAKKKAQQEKQKNEDFRKAEREAEKKSMQEKRKNEDFREAEKKISVLVYLCLMLLISVITYNNIILVFLNSFLPEISLKIWFYTFFS